MTVVVPLKRKFSPIPDAFQREDIVIEEVWPGHFQRPAVEWDTLEQAWRVVILAEAGAGKTHELRSTAARLVEGRKSAFFIRLEDIHGQFETAFEVGSHEGFVAWEQGTGEAWFFLDSVDEMRLTDQRAFEDALQHFATRIARARHRAHIYISSRPYAWRPSIDRALVEGLLPFAPDEQLDGDDEEEVRGASRETTKRGVELFLLAPLTDADINFYAEFRGIGDVEAFNREVERSALGTLARRPFDLEELIATWRAENSLPDRLSVLQATTRRQLRSVVGAGPANLDAAVEAAGLLAACCILTSEANIRLPDQPKADGINPTVLLPSWSPDQIAGLLATGIFGDAIFGTVRFRHREIRELLAAEWVASRLHQNGGPAILYPFLFRSRYDIPSLALRLRPLFPWLILFDGDVRARAFEISPEVAVEGGDVGRLDREVRVDLLRRLFASLLTPGSQFRGLDYQQVGRIADPELAPEVRALIANHAGNDDAIFNLARLVIQGPMRGCTEQLFPIAIDPGRTIWARMVSASAVMATASRADIDALWKTLVEAPTQIPRRLLADMLEHTPADTATVDWLLAAFDNLEPPNQHDIDNVVRGVHQFIDRLAMPADPADPQPVFQLLSGICSLLDRAPWIEHRSSRLSQAFQWLMPAALHCVERLIVARSPQAFEDKVLAILAAAPEHNHWRSDGFEERKSKLAKLVPVWTELNDAAFWWTVARRRGKSEAEGKTLDDDWPVTWRGHFWAFGADSFDRTLAWIRLRQHPDDRLIALARSFRTFDENDRPTGWQARLNAMVAGDPVIETRLALRLNPPPSPDLIEYQRDEAKRQRQWAKQEKQETVSRAEWRRKLAADPDAVRQPPGIPDDAITQWQWNLFQIVDRDGERSSRSRPVNWPSLEPEFGLPVAEALRDAAIAKWRIYRPGLRSEGHDSDSIPHVLLFAMAGLEIEAGDDGKGLSALPEADVRKALRYVPHELNGFPRWFEPLYKAHRTIAHAFIWGELEWELRTSPADQPLHYVLHDILYYAPWLHAALVPDLLAWLADHHAPNLSILHHVRQILVSGGVEADRLATFARTKIVDPATPADQLPTYHAMLTDSDPVPGIAQVEAHLGSLAFEDAKAFAEEYVGVIVGNRRDAGASVGRYRQPTYLKQLYILSFRYIRSSDDVDRSNGGVYSPDRRDNAQEARSLLFTMLCEFSGEIAYRALVELSELHPEPGYRDWMRVKALERATLDGDVSKMSVTEVVQLNGSLERRAARPGG